MIFLINLAIITNIVCLIFFPAHNLKLLKNFSLAASFVVFIISLYSLSYPFSFSGFHINSSSLAFELPNFILYMDFALDSISLFFILLTTFLFLIVIMTSFSYNYRLKEKFILLFVLELLLCNSFLSIDLLVFYLLFESVLIPMFLLIGIWGSQKNKIFAAYQLFLYTLAGSFFFLIGIIIIYTIYGSGNIFFLKSIQFDFKIESLLFILFLVSFSVKIPMFPFHLWLPKAHVEAPTTGSVLLAGVLLKLGSYAFLRFSLFLFPNASLYFAPLVMSLAILSIIFSSFSTVRQIDLKRIIAYSSIAHMNFLVGGLFSNNLQGISGSLLLQIAHGLSSSALFICIGVLYERYHTRNLYYYRGISSVMPLFSIMFFVFNLANLGFPGTLNFVSEFLLIVGIFNYSIIFGLLSLIGVFYSVIYSMVLISRVLFGQFSKDIFYFSDLSRREFFILFKLLILTIGLGFFPNFLLNCWEFYIDTWFLH
jgi:proton-translocating NADH-quinone oxidoreductase chain M